MEGTRFVVKTHAAGEVRDKDGNLIEQVSGEGVEHLTEAELIERGIPVPSDANKEKN